MKNAPISETDRRLDTAIRRLAGLPAAPVTEAKKDAAPAVNQAAIDTRGRLNQAFARMSGLPLETTAKINESVGGPVPTAPTKTTKAVTESKTGGITTAQGLQRAVDDLKSGIEANKRQIERINLKESAPFRGIGHIEHGDGTSEVLDLREVGGVTGWYSRKDGRLVKREA